MTFEFDSERRHPMVSFTDDVLDAIADNVLQAEVKSFRRCRGGFSHTNVRIDTNRGPFLIRFHPDLERKAIENYMLETLVDEPFAPTLIHAGEDENWSVLSWFDGKPLTDCQPTEEIGEQLGILLSQIHSHTFDAAGIFRADGTFSVEFENVGLAHLEYCLEMLDRPNVKKRLQRSTADIRRILRERVSVYERAHGTQLVHSDFNPKNVIVGNDGRCFAVDWEWSHAGSPFTDIGNFERSRLVVGSRFWEAFELAYGQTHDINESIIEVARHLDLAAQLEFLSWDSDRPKLFRRARRRIDDVLFSG